MSDCILLVSLTGGLFEELNADSFEPELEPSFWNEDFCAEVSAKAEAIIWAPILLDLSGVQRTCILEEDEAPDIVFCVVRYEGEFNLSLELAFSCPLTIVESLSRRIIGLAREGIEEALGSGAFIPKRLPLFSFRQGLGPRDIYKDNYKFINMT